MKVSIAKIRPNPFQVRKHFDRAAIKALANEINTIGFWSPLRAREVDGHYELCFGHRRLEALKHLNWKEVDVDVVKLSDDEMATQSLIENLQREGLTDTEKANGIQRLMKRLDPEGKGESSIDRERVAALMGLSESRISELLFVKTFSQPSQKLIADRKISAASARRAYQLGGNEMIETAAKHQLSLHEISRMNQELAAIPEAKVRERVKKAVVAGRVGDAESLRQHARKVSRQVEERSGKRPPPDLLIVIRSWTKTMHAWAKKLDEVQPYLNYIESEPETANEFKAATRELIDKLKRFL